MLSRAASTPVADKDGVYALFESGDLIALSYTCQDALGRENQASVRVALLSENLFRLLRRRSNLNKFSRQPRLSLVLSWLSPRPACPQSPAGNSNLSPRAYRLLTTA
jgi:hypothetical protein